jgi:hypothetical protein
MSVMRFYANNAACSLLHAESEGIKCLGCWNPDPIDVLPYPV